jgi:hypothetical protein
MRQFSRKEFLKGMAATSMAGAMPWSDANAQSKKEVKRTSTSGAKITNVIPFIHKKASYVKIETDAGVSGWGEGDHEFTLINGKIVTEI